MPPILRMRLHYSPAVSNGLKMASRCSFCRSTNYRRHIQQFHLLVLARSALCTQPVETHTCDAKPAASQVCGNYTRPDDFVQKHPIDCRGLDLSCLQSLLKQFLSAIDRTC